MKKSLLKISIAILLFVTIGNNAKAQWAAFNTGLTNNDVNALAVSGSNIFAGTAVGMFLSTNSGVSWTAINNGLTNTEIHAIAVSGTTIFAGTYGGGVFVSTNAGGLWTAVNTG